MISVSLLLRASVFFQFKIMNSVSLPLRATSSPMKGKILNLSLILTSLLGYLEWGTDRKQFLFQVETEIVSKLFTDPLSVIHPFTILPLVGQILLFITLFQTKPNKVLTFAGIGGIGILLGILLIIGLINPNFKILFSTIPFWVMVYLTFRFHRNRNLTKNMPS